MKNNRNWCLAFAMVAAGLAAALLLGIFYYLYTYAGPRQLARRRALEGPPTILPYAPLQGDSVPAGGSIMAAANVSANNPIQRVEIWLDGALAAQQSAPGADVRTIHPTFEVQLSEGVHALHWRAVDNAGLVGQTASVAVVGLPAGAGAAGAAGGGGVLAQDVQPAPALAGGGAEMPAPPEGASRLDASVGSLLHMPKLFPGILQALPAAPISLRAGFENCRVRLMWEDLADNESGYRVWMQRLGGPEQELALLKPRQGTGIAWYDLLSPEFGIYAFWVEAVNGLGAQSSQVAWVAVNTDCGPGVATQLEIHIESLIPSGTAWAKPYCYLSAENFPEKRLPEDSSAFLQADALGTVGGGEVILVPMPADEMLTLEGDCWSGEAIPVSKGTFQTEVPRAEWDYRLQQARSDSYTISYRVRPRGFSGGPAWSVYSYLDQEIDVPRISSVEVLPHADEYEQAHLGHFPIATWSWIGNAAVTGFSIYVDGITLGQTPLAIIEGSGPVYSHDLYLPTGCGRTYTIQVAANVGEARSLLSAPYIHVQPECAAYADVLMLDYVFHWIKPEDKMSAECDRAVISAHVVVNDLYRAFAGTPTTCDEKFTFPDIRMVRHRGPVPASTHSFRVPLDAQDPLVQIKVTWWKGDNADEFVTFYENNISVPVSQLDRYRQEFTESNPLVSGEAELHYIVNTFVSPQP